MDQKSRSNLSLLRSDDAFGYYFPTYRDHVLPFASLGDQVPVDRVHVAERGVLLEADGAPDDGRQAVQPDLLQVHHLERDEGVVDEQRVATDHGQVGEQATDAAQPFYPENREREEGRAVKERGRRGRSRLDAKSLTNLVVVKSTPLANRTNSLFLSLQFETRNLASFLLLLETNRRIVSRCSSVILYL